MYIFSSQLIQNLKNIFDKFNKVAKLDNFLYDFKFRMTINNFKKTFNEFFTRFTSTIIALNFTNCHKIFNL